MPIRYRAISLSTLAFVCMAVMPLAANGVGFHADAPELSRTQSSVLLLWNKPSDAKDGVEFVVKTGGRELARTRKLSAVVEGLESGREHTLEIVAMEAAGGRTLASDKLEVTTRPAGVVINARDRGAKGDGAQDDTAVIQQAIHDCPAGGTVVIPPGDYLVNHLELKGNMTLHIEKGAKLQMAGRETSQPIRGNVEVAGVGGMRKAGYGALIAAVHADNLTITGDGIIDGNGPTWWKHLEEYRPRLIEIAACTNVYVQGVTLQDPPKFNTLLDNIDHAIFAGVTFLKRTAQASANGDGLDPDSSSNVMIVGCKFGNQDDSISIKAGIVEEDTKILPRPSEHIVVRDCTFDGRLAPGSHPLGIAIGSGASGGVRDVVVKDCEFINAGSLANIRINRSSRYGLVEDVWFENCTYTNSVFPDEPWNRAPISLDLFYYSRSDDNPDAPQPLKPGTPYYRNIHFKNISINNSRGRAIYISGLFEKPLRDITFTNVTAKAKAGFFARNVDGLVLQDVSVETPSGENFVWGTNVLRGVNSAPSSSPLGRGRN